MELYKFPKSFPIIDQSSGVNLGVFGAIDIHLDSEQNVSSALYSFIPSEATDMSDTGKVMYLRHMIEMNKEVMENILNQKMEVILLKPEKSDIHFDSIPSMYGSKMFAKQEVVRGLKEVEEAVNLVTDTLQYTMNVGVNEVLKTFLDLNKSTYHLVVNLNF